MKRTKQPAFGIVGAPVDTAVREHLRTHRPGPDPRLDPAVDAARRGDWPAVAGTMPPVTADPDLHHRAVAEVAELAVEDDRWLNAWLDSTPQDANAWCVHAQAITRLAWRLRTAAPASEVLPEQAIGFRRVLGQAPAACARATALAPGLATPWIVLMSAAQGLGWDHERFRALWAEVSARAPESVAAHRRALHYWLPRWQGSAELAGGFVVETLDRARPGSLLTAIRFEHAFLEGVADPGAIEAALADLAAAPADHPYRVHHRHWLAYLFTTARRYDEALAEFHAIGGYAGAPPWELFADPAGAFAATRAGATGRR